MTMRHLKSDATVHGFRSAFRDWASERTTFAREICEAALAHIVKDKTEAAYRRGDLLEKRRELMATWAAFATTTDAEIIPFRRLS
jgi:integrase